MAQQDPPPAGAPPPPHHAPAHGHGTSTHALPHDPGVSPEDLNLPQVKDFLRGSLPPLLIDDHGHPRAAPAPGDTPAPSQPQTREQFVDQGLARLRLGLLTDSDLASVATAEVIDLLFLLNGIDPQAVRESQPFNADQVVPAGYAVLRTCLTVTESIVMQVDETALGQQLARVARIRRLRALFDPAYQVLEANETQALNRVSKQVGQGLERGMSVIKKNGSLLRALAPALAVREEPVAVGLETKGQNQRLEEKVRADEQAKAHGPGPANPPKTTTTVTTQSAESSAPAAPAPKAPPRHGGHSPKAKP